MKIARALLSVSDKAGLAAFAAGLVELGIEILSTGGTARALREAGIAVRDVSDVTGFPEMMDGRIKTLHPRVHGGLLARRDVPAHLDACVEHVIPLIDLLVVNLYPFQQTITRPGVTLEEAIEQIDIGGPAMLRAAAKNYDSVTVICNPMRYQVVLRELQMNGGGTTSTTRRALAREVFRHTAAYDKAIADYLDVVEGGGKITLDEEVEGRR